MTSDKKQQRTGENACPQREGTTASKKRREISSKKPDQEKLKLLLFPCHFYNFTYIWFFLIKIFFSITQ